MRGVPEARFWVLPRPPRHGWAALGPFVLETARRAAFTGITLGALWTGGCGEPGPSTVITGVGGSAAAAGSGGVGGTVPSTGGASGSGGTIIVSDGGIPVLNTGGVGAGGSGLGGELSPPGIGRPPGLVACDPNAPRAPEGVFDPNGAVRSPFCPQMMWNVMPAKRVLYSWTTPEQVEELRRDRVLLTRTETPGLGRGYAFTSIDELAAHGTAPVNQLLARVSGELFTKVRYAWSNAWATRMGWPGEDYGDRLLRIVLKPEAWIVVVSDRVGAAVIDMNNEVVPFERALAESHRIGAVYFYKVDIQGRDTFSSCSGGYREFIVGNEAMIEEWSLGTEAIREQLEEDATLIETFLESVRANPPPISPVGFNATVACQWDNSAITELDAYFRCLSMPSENYAPLPAQLAALSEALRAAAFEPDPLVVTPSGG
jgi:hypothetical protein